MVTISESPRRFPGTAPVKDAIERPRASAGTASSGTNG